MDGSKKASSLLFEEVLSEEQAERRSKAGNDQANPNTPVSPPSLSLSPSTKSPLAARVVIMGRKIDFRFFKRKGFSIGQKIKEQGWSFCIHWMSLLIQAFFKSFVGVLDVDRMN